MANKIRKTKEQKVRDKLFLAVEQGKLSDVEKILKNKHADVNASREGIKVPVGHYVDARDYDYWVDEGTYFTKETPLSVAFINSDTEMIELLSSHGGKIDEEDISKKSSVNKQKNYWKQIESLKMIFDRGLITSKEAARRVCAISNYYKYDSNADDLDYFLNHKDFYLKDVNANELLITAFRFGKADEVLERNDLQIGKKGTLELAQAAIAKGKPQEIVKLFSRSDFVFNDYSDSYNRVADGIALFRALAKKIKDDDAYVDAVIALLNNPTFTLDTNGREALSISLGIDDKRIFSMLSKRGDVIYGVLKSGDSEMAKSLLSRKGVDINYKNGELIKACAKNKELDPEIARMIMEYDGYNASDDVLSDAIILAAREKNYEVLQDIMEYYPYPLDGINDAVNEVAKAGNYKLIKSILAKNPQVLETVKSGMLLKYCTEKIPENNLQLSSSENQENISDYIDAIRMIMNRHEYDISKDENIGESIGNTASIQQAFESIIVKKGLDYNKWGFWILKNSIENGYVGITEDLIERDDVRIGNGFSKLLELADEKFKNVSISGKLMEKREKEMDNIHYKSED